MSIIDLHMHSFYSDDGEYTPTQLVDMCHDQVSRLWLLQIITGLMLIMKHL